MPARQRADAVRPHERETDIGVGRLEGEAALGAVSRLAARSFPTIDEAVEAVLDLVRQLLGMQVRMINRVVGDQLTFAWQQLPTSFPDLRGVSTPLNHNF